MNMSKRGLLFVVSGPAGSIPIQLLDRSENQ